MFLIDPYRFGTVDVLEDVVLLVGFDGANGSTTFVDDSPSAHTLTANGNAQVSTSSPIFGTGSGLFDGSGDYVSAANHANFDMSNGAFSWEVWVKFDATGNHGIFGQLNNSIGESAFGLDIDSGNLRFRFYPSGTTSGSASGGFSYSAGDVWFFAGVREKDTGGGSDTFRLYTGQAGGSATQLASNTLNSSDTINVGSIPFRLGSLAHGPTYLNGRIDEFRLTKGVCRYPGGTSFTVPALAFPRTLAFSGVPVISTASGFYGVGDELTVTDAGYSGAISSARQWKADGVDIGGATGTSFTLTSSELGKQITVRQTITAPDTSTFHADSAATPVVVNPTYTANTITDSAANTITDSAANTITDHTRTS